MYLLSWYELSIKKRVKCMSFKEYLEEYVFQTMPGGLFTILALLSLFREKDCQKKSITYTWRRVCHDGNKIYFV